MRSKRNYSPVSRRIVLKASRYFRGTQYWRNHARNPAATASAIKCSYVLQSSTRATRQVSLCLQVATPKLPTEL